MKDWETTLSSALRSQWKRYGKALKRCQDRFSEEIVHESRVESRRLLAQLELLGRFASKDLFAEARRTLKAQLDLFNPLRDTQVQLQLVREYGKSYRPMKKLYTALRHREKRSLRKVEREIRKLRTAPLKKMVRFLALALRRVARDPLRRRHERNAILRTVDHAFARLVKRRGQVDPRDAATIHRTRVAFKRFRYMNEALQPLVPEISKTRMRTMQSFQSRLGDLQDTEVFLQRLAKLEEKEERWGSELFLCRRWLSRRLALQIQDCLDQADIIFQFWPLQAPLDF